MSPRALTPLRPPGAVPALRIVLVALGLAIGVPPALSETAARRHGAHAHGEGTLEIALDGHDLLVSFRIPAANVVGFEHAPANDAQRRQVEDARRRFRDGAALLLPSPEAGCRVVEAEAAIGAQAHEHHREHAGHTDDHGHASPAGGAGAAGGDAHSDLHAQYLLRCERPGALQAIEVRLLDGLRGVRALRAQVVTPRYQGAVELTPARTVVPLAR